MVSTLKFELPWVDEKLTNLGEGWHQWPYGDQTALIRRLPGSGRYVAVIPFLFTWGVVVGTSWGYHDDRWCYHELVTAVAAAAAWNGTGEPEGWHRHPYSGRRRPEGDPTKEYVDF